MEMQVDKLEREAVKALLLWLEDHGPLIAPDGRPMLFADGKPVSLEVLNVIAAIRRWTA
jgi:hypothetical protein